jgi:CHASE3 domain sensor protein
MPPAAPPFPAFEDWKRMSEREQDALLDRLEGRRRRIVTGRRLLIGLGIAAVALALAMALVLSVG